MTTLTWDPCPACAGAGWTWGPGWRQCRECEVTGVQGKKATNERGEFTGVRMFPPTRKPKPLLRVVR